MFYNRYRCQHSGTRYTWMGGDSHAEAMERAKDEAERLRFDHLGVFHMRFREIIQTGAPL